MRSCEEMASSGCPQSGRIVAENWTNCDRCRGEWTIYGFNPGRVLSRPNICPIMAGLFLLVTDIIRFWSYAYLRISMCTVRSLAGQITEVV